MFPGRLDVVDNASAGGCSCGPFNAEHVKVVTENGTVFLLGIVNHAEADAAAEIASTTSGVTRVVKLFEYFD